jgi:hypothetical protein
MSKSSRKRNRVKVTKFEQKQVRISLWKKLLSHPAVKASRLLWVFSIGVLSALALVFSLMDFAPRVDVSVGNTFDSKKPFATRFVVENQSLFAIYDVTRQGVWKVGTEPNDLPNQTLYNSEPVDDMPMLKAHARWNVSLEGVNSFLVKPDTVSLGIIVGYRPKFYWCRKTQVFFYCAKPDSDGHFQWFPVGTSDNVNDVWTNLPTVTTNIIIPSDFEHRETQFFTFPASSQ